MRDRLIATIGYLAGCTSLLLWLAVVAFLLGCGCPTAYRYDGGVTARPFYKVELCPNQRERILCDSPTRLPSGGCK